MRVLVALVCLCCCAVIGVGMRGVIVASAAVVRMRVTLLARAFLVMAERHALPHRDGRHALDWDRNGQQGNSKESEDVPAHRRPLYANPVTARSF